MPDEPTPILTTELIAALKGCGGDQQRMYAVELCILALHDEAVRVRARLDEVDKLREAATAINKGWCEWQLNVDARLSALEARVKTNYESADYDLHDHQRRLAELEAASKPVPSTECPEVRRLGPTIEEICSTATALQTEQTMHAAWRKRAEEAEKELASIKASKPAPVTPPDWRERCIVEKADDGFWNVHDAKRNHWWAPPRWVPYNQWSNDLRHSIGIYSNESDARNAIALAPPPPTEKGPPPCQQPKSSPESPSQQPPSTPSGSSSAAGSTATKSPTHDLGVSLSYEQRMAYCCKVCGNVPDENGELQHGKGCCVVSSKGGGFTYVDFYQPDKEALCTGSSDSSAGSSGTSGACTESTKDSKTSCCTSPPTTKPASAAVPADEA